MLVILKIKKARHLIEGVDNLYWRGRAIVLLENRNCTLYSMELCTCKH